MAHDTNIYVNDIAAAFHTGKETGYENGLQEGFNLGYAAEKEDGIGDAKVTYRTGYRDRPLFLYKNSFYTLKSF